MRENLRFFLAIALMIAVAAPLAVSHAQEGSTGIVLATTPGMPTRTSDLQVAMIFYKLARAAPDFAKWAIASPEYQAAAHKNKDYVYRERMQTLRDDFRVMTKKEPIIVSLQARLSAYNFDKKHFIVGNIQPDTFFSYTHAGRNYSVDLTNADSLRKIAVGGQDAVKIDESAESAAGLRVLQLLMLVEPVPELSKLDGPIRKGNKIYYSLHGKVLTKALYNHAGDTLLWEETPGYAWRENTGTLHKLKQQDMLLNLKAP